MATIQEALTMAVKHHRAGQFQQAEAIYRQILQVVPNHADALHLFGVVAHQQGNHDVAIEYIGRAIGLDGQRAAFHNNLGEAYRALGRLAETIACYERALQLKPDYPEAHNNLGVAWESQGKLAGREAKIFAIRDRKLAEARQKRKEQREATRLQTVA